MNVKSPAAVAFISSGKTADIESFNSISRDNLKKYIEQKIKNAQPSSVNTSFGKFLFDLDFAC